MVRRLFSDWSDRTFARYWNAQRRIRMFGPGDELANREFLKETVRSITRKNGTFSVARLESIAEDVQVRWLLNNFDFGSDAGADS
jgi:hypothetical protein